MTTPTTAKNQVFRITTTVPGTREPFVDWYEADTTEQALVQYRDECRECGIPADATFTVREATETESRAFAK